MWPLHMRLPPLSSCMCPLMLLDLHLLTACASWLLGKQLLRLQPNNLCCRTAGDALQQHRGMIATQK
jgi:hypothetical protein